jgi:hypothetical protein
MRRVIQIIQTVSWLQFEQRITAENCNNGFCLEDHQIIFLPYIVLRHLGLRHLRKQTG